MRALLTTVALVAALSLAAEAGADAAAKRSLSGRIYTFPGADIGGVCGGICWEALAFTSERFVHSGVAETVAIPRCARTTYDPKRDVGCRRYRLSRDGRTVTAGAEAWRVSRDRSRLTPVGKGTRLFLDAYPRAGARYAAALNAINVFGFFPNQTVVTRFLTLDRDGRFALSSSFLGSFGVPGTIETHYAGSGPDERGRYEFLRRGSLVLRYDSGSTARHATFFMFGEGNRTTARDGFYIGGSSYLPPDGD